MEKKDLLGLLKEVEESLFFFSDEYRIGSNYYRGGVADLKNKVSDAVKELKEEA